MTKARKRPLLGHSFGIDFQGYRAGWHGDEVYEVDASCSCGWMTSGHKNVSRAKALHQAHRDTVRSEEAGRVPVPKRGTTR